MPKSKAYKATKGTSSKKAVKRATKKVMARTVAKSPMASYGPGALQHKKSDAKTKARQIVRTRKMKANKKKGK